MTSKVFRSISLISLLFIALSMLTTALYAAKPLRFVATVPEVSWLIKQMAPTESEVVTLSSGNVDLHFLEARIDYIIKLRKADIVCFTGLGLEEGWLPKIIERSGNFNIQQGQKGFCNLGQGIQALGLIKGQVDRSMGHIHVQGNPHYSSSPMYMIQALEQLTKVLIANRPGSKQIWKTRETKVKKRLTQIYKEISKKLRPLTQEKTKTQIVSYHSEFDYFLKTYGLGNVGMIEDKPGLAPSGARIALVAKKSKKLGVKLALYTDFNSHSVMDKFKQLSKIPTVKIRAHAFGDEYDSYLEWQKEIAKRILSAASL